MAVTVDTVKNFAEWDQPQWLTFFEKHGVHVSCLPIPEDVKPYVLGKEFQEAMVKVGICGSRAIFEQLPSFWDTELSRDPNYHKQPCSFPRVPFQVTHVMYDIDGKDEALLIKQEKETDDPLMLLRMGNEWHVRENAPWDRYDPFKYSAPKDTSLIKTYETVAKVAKIFVDLFVLQSTKSSLTEHLLPPPIVQIVCSYYGKVLDESASQDMRLLKQTLYRQFDNSPPCHNFKWVDADAQKKASALIVGYIGTLEVDPPPAPKEAESWCAYLSEKACSFFNWIMSLFN